jgi:hypothetical protein
MEFHKPVLKNDIFKQVLVSELLLNSAKNAQVVQKRAYNF